MLHSDLIRVNDLLITVLLHSGSRWPSKGSKPTAQPVHVSLAIPHDISSTARSDDLSQSINYSTLASTLRTSLSPAAASLEEPAFESLEQIVFRCFDLLLLPEPTSTPRLPGAQIRVVQLKPPLHCQALAVEGVATCGADASWRLIELHHIVENLECYPIVGVNPAERLERQLVRINITVNDPSATGMSVHWLDFRTLTRRLHQKVEATSYLTLEALASFVAVETLQHLQSNSNGIIDYNPKVSIKAAKPCALVFADSSEVEITRVSNDYPTELHSSPRSLNHSASGDMHSAAIALGSNIGDKFQNIELALRLLENPLSVVTDRSTLSDNAFLFVVNTSFLYESAPMYVTDQPSFINCACMIETNIPPVVLLQLVKKIEEIVGRRPSFQNGPRAIDLDIVLYDELVLDTRMPQEQLTPDNLSVDLVIPHPRMPEREFVLRPLFDMIPEYVHPSLHKTLSTLLHELLLVSNDPPMEKVLVFPRYPLPPNVSSPLSGIGPVPSTLTFWRYTDSKSVRKVQSKTKGRTRLMATLNATPDSFSDGSTHNTIPSALAYIRQAARASVDIMDIGGYSTRPGAAFVSVDEEIDRVVPIVQAMRSAGSTTIEEDNEEIRRVKEMPISIDTFRWEVTEKAILAGANCINDVYAFTGPQNYPYPALEVDRQQNNESMRQMKGLARKFAVPVVLMHSRGDAGMNKDYSAYSYSDDGAVIEAVREELGLKVDQIVKGKGSIRRWNVIVDPGIGFSKTVEDNLELLRRGGAVTADTLIGRVPSKRKNPLTGFPQLIGTSRKSFLGVVLANARGRSAEAKDRAWATASAVSCAVQQGALVVRVHDTHEMSDVVAIADALWR
ncbi:Dihydropteroate synthase [Lentinula aciculospora]|uniref:Dihydropteroate synthase n=1 Tax=Lentinula aciculospora TaxID=153920 RepID=A0A9W9DXW5_9AGAR|nr:Dihydropteroate synthase [Lentinula aciculospora]